MSKIAIMADSSSDIPKELAEEFNIEILPLTISFGDEIYTDYYELDNSKFFEMLETSDVIPKTAAVNSQLFYEAFKKATLEGKSIICFCISSVGSSTFQTAVLAKNMLLDEMDADIEIIDTMAYSYVFGYPAVVAAKMALEGKSKQEILDRAKLLLDGGNVYFMAGSLKYLKRGGRLNPAAALIGEILDIKPILYIKDGLAGSMEKVRGKKKLLPKVIEIMKKDGYEPNMPTFILYVKLEEAIEVGNVLRETFGIEEIVNVQIGCTIGAHTGPELVGIGYFKKY